MRSGSAEARRHHELREDASRDADVSPLHKHRAAGPGGCQQRCSIPEGDQPEGAFTKNCRQEAMLVQQRLLLQSSNAVLDQILNTLHHS